jgi:hypothetical protein
LRPNPKAPDLWDVIDTFHGGEIVLGGEALTRGQAIELAERLSRHYREWREQHEPRRGNLQCYAM